MSTSKRWPICLAVVLATASMAPPAEAQIDKCQSGLAKNSQKLEVAFAKGFDKCFAVIRKGILKGSPAAAGAASCEKILDKLMGLGPVAADKTKVGKFLAAVDKFETQLVCTAAELEELGHLVSGNNAPGAGPTDFVASWMAVVKQHAAWTENVLDNGDARDLIDLALAAGPEDDDSSNCDAVKGTGCGTDCTGAPTAGYFHRPNLCALAPKVGPPCRLLACNLKATGAVLQPFGGPISFADRKLAMEVCTPPTADLPVTAPDFLMLAGGPAITMRPAPTIPTVPAVTWCIDQVRAEGWCDCTANGIPYEPDTCLDHNADAGGTCPDDGAALESDCVCTASQVGQPCRTPGCTECRHATTGAFCHSGTLVSDLDTIYTGASGANACLLLSTLQFRFLTVATCVNAAGEPLTTCPAVGPATPLCTALGGTSCVASVGPDGIACTADDRPATMETVTIPFTTGSSTSTIESSATGAIGSCTMGNIGMNCATDDDCDTTAFSAGICAANPKGCGTGPNPEDCSFSTGVGQGPSSCTAMKAGLITNFALTGTLPVLENVPDPALKDHIFTFKLDCE